MFATVGIDLEMTSVKAIQYIIMFSKGVCTGPLTVENFRRILAKS